MDSPYQLPPTTPDTTPSVSAVRGAWMRERGLEWIPLDDALIAYAVWNARTGAPIAEQPCRKNEPFAVSETTLACVHPETRELTLYELPVV